MARTKAVPMKNPEKINLFVEREIVDLYREQAHKLKVSYSDLMRQNLNAIRKTDTDDVDSDSEPDEMTLQIREERVVRFEKLLQEIASLTAELGGDLL